MTKLKSFESFADYGNFIGSADDSMLPLISSIGNDTVCYVSKPGLDNNVSGGGDSADGGKMIYLDLRTVVVKRMYVLNFGSTTRAIYEGETLFYTSAYWPSEESVVAVGINLSQTISNFDDEWNSLGGITTIEEVIKAHYSWILDLPQITKEQFYGEMPELPTLSLLVYRNNNEEEAFTIEYEEGMTWEEWCNSDLNNTELVVGDESASFIHYGEGVPELLFYGNFSGDYPVPGSDTINKSDVIIPDMKYITWWYD